ncbi:MAG: hypothetical protein KDA59_23800, partial [Planctomycetales bacterium]|nr:hypothetical protein [Planctomycetales bacterium]
IVDLDSNQFATRERASGKLVDIGKRDPAGFDAIAVAWEYRVANGFESPEVKYGLNKVLNDLAVAYAAYFRRQEVSGSSTTDFACPVNIFRLRRDLPALIADAYSAARNAMSARVDAKLSTATSRSRVKTEIDATTVFGDPVEYRNKILLGVHKGLATPNVGEIRTLVLTIRKTATFEQLRFVVHKMGEPAAIYEQGIVSS